VPPWRGGGRGFKSRRVHYKEGTPLPCKPSPLSGFATVGVDMKYREGWDRKHSEQYTEFTDPSKFAVEIWEFLKDKEVKTLLDLACGNGRDSAFFESKGLEVTGIEGSEVGVKLCKERTKVNVLFHDLEKPLSLQPNSFDVVYSHLGLHYFDDERTKQLFNEIKNILKPNGYLCFRVKSTKDPYYKQFKQIAENMYDKNGHIMHLFSEDYLREVLAELNIIKLEEYYDTHLEGYNVFTFRVIAQKQE
jgi:SAM-dependent methyltransferase